MARGLRSAAIVPLVPRGSDQVPEALALSESFDPDTKRAVEVPRRGMEWVRSGAVIGGETRGSEGYRRDAKGEVRRHIAVVVPGQKTASIGLANRKPRKRLVGSNPTPPASHQRFFRTVGVVSEQRLGPRWGRMSRGRRCFSLPRIASSSGRDIEHDEVGAPAVGRHPPLKRPRPASVRTLCGAGLTGTEGSTRSWATAWLWLLG
jgi:hypothetical protein